MFDRKSFKSVAKSQLKSNWSAAALVTLVQLVISLVFSGASRANSFFSLLNLVISGVIMLAVVNFYLLYKDSTPETRPDFQVFIKGLDNWFISAITYLWFCLWTFLWMLLLIVPGIVKALAYSQMFYIVAENPDIDYRQAMKMSIKMTQGFKADLFLLGLSFIGWLLLSALTCGILLIWVLPYMNLTFTHTYAYLKETSLRNGTLVEADFKPASIGVN